MTIMSMSEGTPVFKAGAAVAPVTDWNYYDTVYGERFMRTPKENAEVQSLVRLYPCQQLAWQSVVGTWHGG